MERKSNEPNGVVMDVVEMDGDLVLSSHQVDFGEYGTTENLAGVIMDMTDKVAVENGKGVSGSVIAAATPPVVLLFDI
jgi:hypothetical protein